MTARRKFAPEQKAEIVRRHLAGKEPVSDLADQFDLQPSQIHLWVKQVLDQADRAFLSARRNRLAENPERRRLATLEETVARKDIVILELLQQMSELLVGQHRLSRVS